ncbi:MAG: chemotaxis protein CheB, partial [Bacteroidota bacterium]
MASGSSARVTGKAVGKRFGERLDDVDAVSALASDGVPQSTPPSTTTAPPFLVAAVGASAGGLEAFSRLLAAIPGDSPLALVIVQHLARDQRSILPELLVKTTALTVVLAEDGQKIEPRHVYVIPVDARMTVTDGHLRIRPSSIQRPVEGTVDVLFRSVASEYKERGI